MPGRATARRGRPPSLALADVVAAAERVLAAEGIDGVTMRRVAAELGASPMALYGHVRDKDELLVHLLDASIADVVLPAPDPDPRERIVATAAFVRTLIDERRWVLDVIAPGDRFAPRALLFGDRIVGAFVDLGLGAAQAVDAYRAVWFLLLGELTQRHGRERRIARDELSAFAQETMRALDPATVPHLAAGYAAGAADRPADPDVAVRALVDGLAAE